MQIAKRLFAFAFFLIVAFVVAMTFEAYLARTGKNVALLRKAAAVLGTVAAGQETEKVDLEIRVRPDVPLLTGTARLRVGTEQETRRRLYFLLNHGLRIRRIWQEQPNGSRRELSFYRLWPVVVIDLARPLRAGQTTVVGIEYAGDPAGGLFARHAGRWTPEEVVLPPDALWYPTDLQGFFNADVTATLPSSLVVAHNGREISRTRQGRSQRVHWTTTRPVAALGLVAGRYEQFSREEGDKHYHFLLESGVDLDTERILTYMEGSDKLFRQYFGNAGFDRLTLVVNRGLGRGFNDGTGLIGLPLRYFRQGDYGLAALAHAVAHNWWGGTVGEKWLQPGTGGEWLVEGFAEFASLLAVREQQGKQEFLRRLERESYDPAEAGVLAQASVIDNVFDAGARATIYRKGAYVTYQLQRLIGNDAFLAGCRRLLDRFRYRQVGDADIEKVFAETSGKDLSDFFATWVRSQASVDLALDPREGGAEVRNHAAAVPSSTFDLWRLAAGEEPERQQVKIGARTALGDVEFLILDPELAVPDMFRYNNMLPRRDNPRAVATSARGEVMVVFGEPYPWAPAVVSHLDRQGQVRHTWAFDRGLRPEPKWTADGTRILGVERLAPGRFGSVALYPSDGSRRGSLAAGDATGTPDAMVMARGARLVKIRKGRRTVLLEEPGAQLTRPVASPDGRTIAYAAHRGEGTDLRVVDTHDGTDRLLLSWPSAPKTWKWSPDGSRLFAVLGGDWDWQLWEIPADGAPPFALIRQAASIGDPAVAADGNRIAVVVVAAAVEFGRGRPEIFVLDRRSGDARRLDLGGNEAHSVAWLDGEHLLAVVSDPSYSAVPPRRELRRVTLGDGTMSAFP